MKQHHRFNHQQYLNDLQGVQERLERVRSNSRTKSQINRNSSRKRLEQDVPSFPLSKDYSANNLLRNQVNRESNLTKIKPKGDWNTRNKNLAMLGESSKLDRCITTIKNKVNELSFPEEESINLPCHSIRSPSKVEGKKPQMSDNIFLQKLSQLYHIPESSCTSQTLQQVIKEVQIRDRLYRIVQSRYPNQNPSNYQKILSQMVKRQQLLIKIIDTFKIMSKVDIQDYQQLYDFLRDQ